MVILNNWLFFTHIAAFNDCEFFTFVQIYEHAVEARLRFELKLDNITVSAHTFDLQLLPEFLCLTIGNPTHGKQATISGIAVFFAPEDICFI